MWASMYPILVIFSEEPLWYKFVQSVGSDLGREESMQFVEIYLVLAFLLFEANSQVNLWQTHMCLWLHCKCILISVQCIKQVLHRVPIETDVRWRMRQNFFVSPLFAIDSSITCNHGKKSHFSTLECLTQMPIPSMLTPSHNLGRSHILCTL